MRRRIYEGIIPWALTATLVYASIDLVWRVFKQIP